MNTTNHITKIDFGKNMPSFMKSTLSITYILTIIIMGSVFVYLSITKGEIEMITFAVLLGVVTSYQTARNSLPNNPPKDEPVYPVEKEKVSDTARGIGE